MPPIALIIPAAGAGTRMKTAARKPFLALEGETILNLTLERFLGVAGIAQIVLALNPKDYERKDEIIFSVSPLGVTDVVEGGESRTESVANALAALNEAVEIVLIHDAVRPFVSKKVIEGVAEAASRAGAAIAAVPMKDTAKRVEGGVVRATLPRRGLYAAQTPQGFRRDLIEEVYAGRSPQAYTDDAALVEEAGGAVEVVESSPLNFKITTPEDLELASAVLRAVRAGRLHF